MKIRVVVVLGEGGGEIDGGGKVQGSVRFPVPLNSSSIL